MNALELIRAMTARLERADAELGRLRADRVGNPNHVPSGPEGGQFASGPGGHGKHWARRQRRKARLRRFHREHKANLAEMKAGHRKDRKELLRDQRRDWRGLKKEQAAERKELLRDQARERKGVTAKDEVRENRQSHRRERREMVEAQQDERNSRMEDYREDRRSTRESQREERRELAGNAREELAERYPKRKSAGGGKPAGRSLEDRVHRALAWIEAEIGATRDHGGNPNHVASGPRGGQFTAGPGGHGKHWAKRQRRKARLRKKGRELRSRQRQERKDLRARHAAQAKSAPDKAGRKSAAESYRKEREAQKGTHKAEREKFVAHARESLKSRPRDYGHADQARLAEAHAAMSADWKKGLAKGDRADVEKYTGSAFEEVNSLARHGKMKAVPGSDVTEQVARRTMEGTDRALASARLDRATVVYRGVQSLKAIGLKGKNLVGAAIQDKGFLSTSLEPKVAGGFATGKDSALIRITAPKGSRGASVHGITMMPREYEVLFARGARLKITKVEKEGNQTVLHAELSHDVERSLAPDVERSASSPASGGDRLAAKFGWEMGDVEITPGPGEDDE